VKNDNTGTIYSIWDLSMVYRVVPSRNRIETC